MTGTVRRWLVSSIGLGIVWVLAGCDGWVREPLDTTPPRVEAVRVTPSEFIVNGQEVQVEATVTDVGLGVDKVRVVVSYPSGIEETKEMTPQGGKYLVSFLARWETGQVLVGQEVVAQIKARDKAGNEGVSSETRIRAISFTPPEPPPL